MLTTVVVTLNTPHPGAWEVAACAGQFRATLYDQDGVLFTPPAALPVSVSGPDGIPLLYGVINCLGGQGVSVNPGWSFVNFFVVNTAASTGGSMAVTIGGVTGTIPLDWAPGPASKLMLDAVATEVDVGQCTATLVARVTDTYGNTVPNPGQDVTVTVASSPGSTTSGAVDIHTANTCGGGAGPFTIPMGQSNVSFHARGTYPGDAVITATTGGRYPPATATQRVSPATFAVTQAASRTLDVNRCVPFHISAISGVGTHGTLTLPAAMTITANTGGLQRLYSDACCRIAPGTITLPAGTAGTDLYVSVDSMTPDSLNVAGSGFLGQSTPLNPVAPSTNGWWDRGWCKRIPLTLTTTTSAIPSSYSVLLTTNLTAAGAAPALSNQNDVRVVRHTVMGSTEMDRAPPEGVALTATGNTTLFFRHPDAVGTSTAVQEYWLYVDNPAAAAPPANKSNVYLLFDDFESGNLTRWNVSPVGVFIADTQHHPGSSVAACATSVSTNSTLVATGLGSETDLLMEASWAFTETTMLDAAMGLRSSTTAGMVSQYETRKVHTAGLNLSLVNAGIVSEVVAPPAGQVLVPGTWHRVGLAVLGTQATVFRSSTTVIPSTAMGTNLSTGAPAFRVAATKTGDSFCVDDVVVRRLASPEPTITVGTTERR